MPKYIRHRAIANITLNEERIKQINVILVSRYGKLENQGPSLIYTIKFDGKIYRTQFFEELLLYFNQSKKLECVVFTLDTQDSINSKRVNGTSLDLNLDKGNSQNCFLIVASDDPDWVDASFLAIQDVLLNYNNRIYKCMRTAWTPLTIQLFGVILGFSLSILGAIKISPKLTIDNSLALCFLFFLLIFSNVWSYLNKKILELIDKHFPCLQFYRPDIDKLNWLVRDVISGIVVIAIVAIVGFAYSHLISILGSILKT